MTKEEQLISWCNQRILKHSLKSSLNDMMIVDGCKQIITKLSTVGWDALKSFVKEQQILMSGSNMVGPHLLANFYKETSAKIWSIEPKGK